MGQAMDSWLVTRQTDAEDLPQLVGALVGMIRGTFVTSLSAVDDQRPSSTMLRQSC
jgi:hypothetical protein